MFATLAIDAINYVTERNYEKLNNLLCFFKTIHKDSSYKLKTTNQKSFRVMLHFHKVGGFPGDRSDQSSTGPDIGPMSKRLDPTFPIMQLGGIFH